MNSSRTFTRKTLVVATAAVLALYVGTIPRDMTWEEGMSSTGLVYAAGRKGGGSSHDAGSSHDHDDSSHTDDGHDDTEHDHDDSDHGDSDDGHSSGGKGKGPKYRGGRSGSGSTKGRGGASQAVIEKIFENL